MVCPCQTRGVELTHMVCPCQARGAELTHMVCPCQTRGRSMDVSTEVSVALEVFMGWDLIIIMIIDFHGVGFNNNNNNNNNNSTETSNLRFLQSPHCTRNCLQHVRSSGPGAIVCKSSATHRKLIMCNKPCATWYKGTAQLISLTELKSHLFQLHFIG